MESDRVKRLRKKLEGKLIGLSDIEKAFAITICTAFEGETNKKVGLGYIDYHLWHSLINKPCYDHLKNVDLTTYNDFFKAVYFVNALNFLEEKNIIERKRDGDYKLLI